MNSPDKKAKIKQKDIARLRLPFQLSTPPVEMYVPKKQQTPRGWLILEDMRGCYGRREDHTLWPDRMIGGYPNFQVSRKFYDKDQKKQVQTEWTHSDYQQSRWQRVFVAEVTFPHTLMIPRWTYNQQTSSFEQVFEPRSSVWVEFTGQTGDQLQNYWKGGMKTATFLVEQLADGKTYAPPKVLTQAEAAILYHEHDARHPQGTLIPTPPEAALYGTPTPPEAVSDEMLHALFGG